MDNRVVHILNVGSDFLLRKSKNLSVHKRQVIISLVAVVSVLAVFYVVLYRAPVNFPEGGTITIEEGAHLSGIAQQFEREEVVRSAFALRILILLFNGEREIFAGDYYFNSKTSLLGVAQIITRGEFGLVPVKVTLFEGATVDEMALIFENNFDLFDVEEFLELALPKEGYLFPDTYFFLPTVTPKKVIKVMEENFTAKIQEISDDIDEFGESLEDVVIMASLLEKEARTTKTRRTIAGILWNRIAVGMLLQVDAVFLYINGKNTFELSLEDLQIDSLYNTYLYPGLPRGPIANPGLDALKAAVNPIETSYFYYLSDREGIMYYSKTFEEHKFNKERYLRQ
ncbi:endolytic transglycosylase MltG [Patescibacteria group bacterium]|nr:endolytic transglycosylase MltG [Patescibacteria group bacterium]